MNIVGVSGLPRSGKDTVAEILMANGYYGVSLGDIVRQESTKRHVDKSAPISIENMTETSNYLRSKMGADFALQQAVTNYKHASEKKNYIGLVVYSIRAPAEVDFILSNGNGGKLIWVEADDEVRLARNNANLRPGEKPMVLEELLSQERLQWEPNPDLPLEIQMDLKYVKSKATLTIENNGDSKEEFVSTCLEILSKSGLL